MNTICILCGNYMQDNKEIYDECKQHEKEDFNKIREVLSANSYANILQLVQGTAVDISTIKRLIRAGSLVASSKDKW